VTAAGVGRSFKNHHTTGQFHATPLSGLQRD